jgi:hypothetical protein
MVRDSDSPAVLGRYTRAASAPRGLRKVMKLGEIERALKAVDGWRELEARVDADHLALVTDLRNRGASWDSIGWLLGVSGEAVRQRFSDLDLCGCGKPRSHLFADPDSAEWACRVPQRK